MRYVAAYALAVIGGNSSPSTKDIKKILTSVGVDCDADAADKVVDALKDKTLEEVISEGKEKLSAVPSGGGGAAPAASAGGGGAAAAAEAPKKEEKKVEEEEEEDEDMGFGLFD